jgi:ferredoxin
MAVNSLSASGPPASEELSAEFFVEERCIGCMVCAEIAPETFVPQADPETVAVGRQPLDAEAVIRCEEARELCPVDAIGRRGSGRRPFSG